MANQSVSVQLEKVTKEFRDPKTRTTLAAVREVDLEVGSGELVTLLGPSGCGKTTTLRMVAGFELPTRGRIVIGGEDVTFRPPDQRATATVFQSYGLFPHLDVFDNVAYGLRVRKLGKAEIEERVLRVLGLVGLSALVHRAPSRLSGGQQQRVALARSLVVEPHVLLLDEPLSNLDVLLREQMRVEIRRIQKSMSITAIYVTHDRVEAMSLSDRIIVMKDGVIRQIGSPPEVYTEPVSRFVAGFVGKTAFFPTTVLGRDGTSWTCEVAGKQVAAAKAAPGVSIGSRAVLMARPESLRLGAPGEGAMDGTVSTNVYLGHSVESYVTTEHGEVLVQVDDPAERPVPGEGERVSVAFNAKLARLLPESEE